jgi:protein-tyrosine phosphatase
MILKEGGPFLASIPKAIWEPLMRVHPDYLQAMFDQLEASHGSVKSYLRDVLGIGAAEIDTLRSNLLA